MFVEVNVCNVSVVFFRHSVYCELLVICLYLQTYGSYFG